MAVLQMEDFRRVLRMQHAEHGEIVERLISACDNTVRLHWLLQLRHYKRMADACKDAKRRCVENAERNSPTYPSYERILAINSRVDKFHDACLAKAKEMVEIDEHNKRFRERWAKLAQDQSSKAST